MVEYPANSHNSKINEPLKERPGARERKLKVVKGTVTRRKKPLGARFIGLFLSGEDIKSAAIRVAMESLLPAAKDMVVDAGKDFLERVFHGEGYSSTRRSSSTGHVNYNRMGSSSGSRSDDSRSLSRRARATHNFDNIDFNSREDALEVIEYLYTLVDDYGHATVADFYEIAGVDSEPQDETWGWTDTTLRNVDAVASRGGRTYHIRLPRPTVIRNR